MSGCGDSQSGQITPEIVKKVSKKVYAMWLKEMQIENERRQLLNKKRSRR